MAAELEERRVRHTGLFGSALDDEAAQAEEIDFKMVTFSLGGKEYGIDIMMVKEIAKFDEFTYVPNTPPFVSGVYNLRGDIISVIDMRRLFGLPVADQPKDEPFDGLILRLESGLIGVVVDSIDKVVGISSESIQEPHPIFADVNIKYISGVVEHEDALYIILDAERVLGVGSTGTEQQARATRTVDDAAEDADVVEAVGTEEPVETTREGPSGKPQTIDNVAETLAAVAGFYVSDLNRTWVEARLRDWGQENNGQLGIGSEEECDRFLAPFFTASTARLWNAGEIAAATELFEELSEPLQAWHPGCREGYETYSLACVLRAQHPDARIKIYASDDDLLQVSAASALSFSSRSIPEFYEPFLVEGVHAHSFNEEISGSIVFEFSDLAHATTVPASDIVLIRDVLSFTSAAEQDRLLNMLQETIKRPGIIITGNNEDLTGVTNCTDVSNSAFRAFLIE